MDKFDVFQRNDHTNALRTTSSIRVVIKAENKAKGGNGYEHH